MVCFGHQEIVTLEWIFGAGVILPTAMKSLCAEQLDDLYQSKIVECKQKLAKINMLEI